MTAASKAEAQRIANAVDDLEWKMTNTSVESGLLVFEDE